MTSSAEWCKPSAATAATVNHTMHTHDSRDNTLYEALWSVRRGASWEHRSTWNHLKSHIMEKTAGGLSIIMLLITIIFLVNNLASQSETSKHLTVKREANMIENNAWYKSMVVNVRKLNITTNCYVCAQMPHHAASSIPAIPWPLNASEVLGVTLALTVVIKKPATTPDQRHVVSNLTGHLAILNVSVADYSGHGVRILNASAGYPDRIFEPLFETNPSTYPPGICFYSTCNKFTTYLGDSRCNIIHNATCGSTRPSRLPCLNSRKIAYMSNLNLTDHLAPIPNKTGHNNPLVVIPNEEGYGALQEFVWVCGKYVYQVLRPGWCGKCFMAKLLPYVRIAKNLTYHQSKYNHYVPSKSHRQTREIL